MKRFISLLALFSISMCAPAPITEPANASRKDPDLTGHWNTENSMGCMMLRHCQNDVKSIKSWKELGEGYDKHDPELTSIFSSLNKLGVEMYIGGKKYFPQEVRGVYNVKENRLFLNEYYLNQPIEIVKTVRHEGWHAVQDCMAGTIKNNMSAIVWDNKKVPDWIKGDAVTNYADNRQAIPYEAEAMYAAHSNFYTADGLRACANPNVKLWEFYSPTPSTFKWLQMNGYIK